METDQQKPAVKGGGCALAIVIVYFILWLYPISAAALRSYEGEMLIFPLFLGTPLLLLGTALGIYGAYKGWRRAKIALLVLWTPVILLILTGIVASLITKKPI